MLRIGWIRYAISACTCAVLLASCGITQAAVKTPVPKRKVPQTSIPKTALPKREPKPIEIKPVEVQGQLVLSPSAEAGSPLYTSWPLVLSVSLWRKALTPDDKGNMPTVEPITIKAKEGSWREALVLNVKNASGTTVVWPLHPVKQADPSLTLGVDDSASAEWWLDPLETKELPVGEYTITVSFDSKLVEGLPDGVGSDSFQLKIAKEPSPLDKDTESDKQLQIAMLSMLKDDSKTATDLIDKVLALDPESIGGNRMKSMLLLHDGKKREAVSSLDKALNAYFKKYPDACPPAGLFQLRADILKDINPETAKDDEESPKN